MNLDSIELLIKISLINKIKLIQLSKRYIEGF